ncbi:MAG: hypothetical protein AA931_10695 [Peptococcaceae bacterium 1109]|nr:MAG: hypothetical protein AA931_10695 [Peptococcaceae bacterium 1109]
MDLGAANTRNYDRTGTEVNFGPISGGSIFIKKFQDQPVQLQYTESLGTELERDICASLPYSYVIGLGVIVITNDA